MKRASCDSSMYVSYIRMQGGIYGMTYMISIGYGFDFPVLLPCTACVCGINS